MVNSSLVGGGGGLAGGSCRGARGRGPDGVAAGRTAGGADEPVLAVTDEAGQVVPSDAAVRMISIMSMRPSRFRSYLSVNRRTGWCQWPAVSRTASAHVAVAAVPQLPGWAGSNVAGQRAVSVVLTAAAAARAEVPAGRAAVEDIQPVYWSARCNGWPGRKGASAA